MPIPTIPKKINIICNFKTFLRIIASGNDRPITDIINASAVPSDAPFSSKT